MSMLAVIVWIALLPVKAMIVMLALCWLASIPAVFQEQKIWKSRGVPSLSIIGLLKVYALNVTWMSLCFLGSVATVIYCAGLMLIGTPKQDLSDKCRIMANYWVERNVARLVTWLIVGPVVFKGLEHKPKPSDDPMVPAPVYIANHASQLDVAIVYCLNMTWRWIAKSSIMFLPGVGQIIYLSDHVLIDRFTKKSKASPASPSSAADSTTATKTDPSNKPPPVKTSARNLYIQSNKSIQTGVPMFFFPQGTRRMVERLPFKDGAFKIAIMNEAPIYPITLDIPPNAWNTLYPFVRDIDPVVITMHPPIPVQKTADLDKLKTQCFDTIYSILPDYSKES